MISQADLDAIAKRHETGAVTTNDDVADLLAMVDELSRDVAFAEDKAAEAKTDHERKVWELAASAADSFRAAVTEVHRAAGHPGQWETCTDPTCSALEWWLHWEGGR